MAATFAQLLGDLHRERFVGRADELAECERWLDDPGAVPILAVSGVGGIGKTWLLEELARRTGERGGVVHRWDAAAALADGGLDSRASESLQGGRGAAGLLIFDAVDGLGPAVGDLQRVLAGLRAGTRVVLSSRRPLRDGVWRSWEPLVRHLELGPLSWDEQQEYLDLRGVDDAARREQVRLRSGGHPLTLSLAVDLIVGSSAEELAGSSIWRSTVRMTVEDLVGEVGSRFRDAVDVAAVLHRADREALGAVLGAAEADQAFVRLGSWSASRVVAGRLVLHDDVRRSVVEDLRLHRPERLDEIRRSALRYYRRAAAVGGDVGARWSIERLHLVGRDLFGVSYLYDEHPALTVVAGTPQDIPEVLEMRRRTPAVPGVPAVESDPERLAAILADPQCVTHLARHATGALAGFGFYLRLTEDNRRLLGEGGAMAALVAAAAERLGCPGGVLPDESNILYLSSIVTPSDDFLAPAGVLANNVLSVLLGEGAYLFVPALPHYVQLTDGFLMQPLLPGVTEAGHVLQARFLDLSRCGLGGWVRAMMAGRPLPQIPIGPDLTTAVNAAVANFDDDAVLAASPLGPLAEPDDQAPSQERAHAVRALLDRALHAHGAWPTPDARVRDALADAGIVTLPEVGTSPGDGPVSASASAPVSDGDVHLRVLGGLTVTRNGRTALVPHGAVGTAVAFVGLRRSVLADELIDLLWPEVEPSVGRERLRGVLSRVRRSVAPDLLVRRGPQVTLGESVVVDADTFTAAAAAALRELPDAAGSADRCRAAVGHYGGELLPADRYSEWTAAPREGLARLLLDLLDRLADQARAAGDVEASVRWMERAIDADPYDEDRYLRAAQLLAAAGRRGRALAMLARAQSAAAALGVPIGEPVRRLRHQLHSTG